MSAFGNNNRNPFGTLGGVIYEHRDSLWYTVTAGIVLGDMLTGGRLYPYVGVSAVVREFARAAGWGYRGLIGEKRVLVGGSAPENYSKFMAASNVGVLASLGIAGFGAELAKHHRISDALVVGSLLLITSHAAIKIQSEELPNGLKDVLDAYGKMWNHKDDDGKGGHTKHVADKIKEVFGKAQEWVSDRMPQPGRIPATVPVRELASADI